MLARRFIELPLEKRRLFLEGLREEGVEFSLLPIPAGVAAEDRDAPSYAQRRMWFLWQLEPQSGAYNLPCAVRLHGALDEATLQRAFADLVARHETLRTVFRQRADDSLYLAPLADAPLIEHEDLSALEVAAREVRVREEAECQSWLPFDLEHGPLLRIRLLRLADDEHVLLLTLHHIVADGWSMNLLIDELARLYDGHALGAAVELPALPIQYADYALWQRRWLEAGEQTRQLDYWRVHLGDDHTPLALPADRPRPAVASHRGTRHEFAVDAELAEGLRGLARAQGISLFMLLLGSFGILLQRYSGQADIRVGVPIANRTRSETEGLIGFFVNTQVLRLRLDQQLGMDAYLQRIREITLGAQDHQELPFERLVETFDLARSLSHNPLFQVMYNHQPQVADISALQTAAGLTFSQIDWRSRTTQFDLTLDTYERGGKLHAALTYAEDLFDAASIERMAHHLGNLWRAMVAQPARSLADLPMLDDGERHLLVEGWNATTSDYPLQRGVHQLFEEQAARTPTAPALAFGEQRLDYAALNRQANRLAHALIERGVSPDSLVGVAMERSVEMVVALLAILKAGGAYVPVDPEYPIERQAYMLEDSGVKLLLSQSHLQLPLAEGVQRIDLDQAGDWLRGYGEDNPGIELDGENLAYVIYTSGSTGKPKGAGNRHSALTNRLCWMQQAYALGAGDTVLQKTPFSFDVSVWEFFWPLMTGARLVVAAPGDHRDPAKLVETINRESVTTLHFVPSMLQAFLQDENVASCSSLQRIVCSGEALPTDAQQQVFARLPQAALYNLYGPTEAAIDVTHWTCVEEGKDAVPIGKPIANLACYILDGNLEPVPVGVLGELYLAGQGLARGYHQRPALTAERFVASPFVAGERLYRSGDLARYRADGVIEYAGRIDHQVKLHGLRIELGEIEARLLEHPQVREAAVLAVDGKQLVGYVVLAEESQGWRETLATHLAVNLPEYMVPTQWLALERMPLSANGKLERKALPRPDASMAQHEYVAPQNEIEQRLAAIWQDVLGRERIGRDDNFFELGGDSIVSIQVVSRARQAGIRFTPKDLFRYQTVRSLAAVAKVGNESHIAQGPVVGEVVLTPIQRWFFDLPMSRRSHWNQSLLLDAQQPIVPEILEKAVQSVVRHHDALRLRFVSERGEWRQWYADVAAEQNLLWHGPDSTAFYDEVQRSLDLAQGPLLRAALLQRPEGGQRLLLAIHHGVVDGVSWRILLEDLQVAYQSLATGQVPLLPAKTSSYQAWAARLEKYAQVEQRQFELSDWLSRLEGSVQELPRDNPQGGLLNRHGAALETRLDAEHTERLLKDAPAAYRTQVNDLLLSALARVLCRWSGHESVLVQMEGHGREDLFEGIDLTRTLGWFTSLYPVKLTPANDLTASLKAVKEQLRGVPNKGLGYGVLRYLGTPKTQQLLAGLPQPRVTFNYLGQFDSQFDEKALFVPAGQGGGKAQADDAPLANWLTVEGRVYGGELSLRWGYSSEMYRRETIQQLADGLLTELYAVIEHCTSTDTFAVTPSDFPLAILTQAQLDALPVSAQNIEDLYPLSPMQQGMLFHTLYGQEGGSGDYINQMRVDIDGLDVQRFRAAWESTVANHDILRTGFVWQGLEIPVQMVRQPVEVPFAIHDWRGQPLQAQALDTLAEAERGQRFELSQAPLLRLVLVRTDEQRYHLIYTHHHILMDGWSNAQLLGEVLQRYAGQTPQAPVGRYRDYIAWLQSQDKAASETFWRAQLAELDEPTRLAQAIRAERREGEGHGEHLQVLDTEQTHRLGEFARSQKVTLNTLVQAAWLLLLQRYTGQERVAFGATVAGRPAHLPGIEQQVGLFINTLPIIATPRPDIRLGDWLQAVQSQNLVLREHEYTPLFEIQRWAGLGGAALFDSIIVFENYPVAEVFQQRSRPSGLKFGRVVSHEQTNYPLTLVVGLGDVLSIHYKYDRAYWSHEAVQRLAQHFGNVFEAFIRKGQSTALGELSLISGAQRLLALKQWPNNQGDTAYVAVHRLIEQRAASTPRAPAVLSQEGRLDYGELNSLANAWAQRLIDQGAGPDTLVGLCSERGLLMVVGLLAILKAGAGYVPLDPQYPRQRLQDILDDSGVRLVLGTCTAAQSLDLAGVTQWLWLDQPLAPVADNPTLRATADNLLALIYTSGSTGRPKGVALTQGTIAAHIRTMAEQYQVTAHDRFVHFASINFDWGTEQWLLPLSQGACCILRGDEIWTAAQAFEVIERERASVVYFPTQYACQLAEWARQEGRWLSSVRCLNVAGEALPREGFEQLQAYVRPQRIVNGYGPTETVITPLLWQANGNTHINTNYAPIGTPVPGRTAYLLDSALQLLDAGSAGELYIGGPCLARGYFGQAALTAERFVPDPFDPVGGGRLYRSGDLVRQQVNGELEFLGRLDHQVKIRGFRVEPGEVEACLRARPDVSEAVVMPRGQGADLHLAAWLVPAQGFEADAGLGQHILDDLRARLPPYMVPARLQLLDRLPLNPNGKVDRKALPVIEADTAVAFSAPQDALEHQVARIWANVLGVAEVGRLEHFFEMGGHSLLATQVVARLNGDGHTGIGVRDLFNHPRLCDFAARLRQVQPVTDNGPQLRALGDKSSAPLSLAQRRLWIAEQFSQGSGAYGMPLALRLDGPLRAECLHQALQMLGQRHEVLRSAVDCDDEGEPLLLIQTSVDINLPFEDLRALDAAEQQLRVLEAQLGNLHQPIALDQAPMLRARLLRLSGEAHVLLLNVHHIISDGWSMALMVNELIASYSALVHGQVPKLESLAVQYSDYAIWQVERERAGLLQASAQWWRIALHGSSGRLALPTDQPRPAQASQAGENLTFDLPQATVKAVRECSVQWGVTPYMLLLAAFQLLMHRVSGQQDLLLGADVAGREHPDLEALIGFFVNVLPLRSQLDEQLDFAAWVARTRTTVLDASEHQALPFDLIVEAVGASRHLGMNPLVQVLFVMNDMPVAPTDLGGLQVQVLPQAGGYSKFDMALFIDPVADGWRVTWQYATELFKAERIQALLRGWLDILDQVVGNPHIQLREITMSVHSEIVAAPAAVGGQPKKDKLANFLKRSAAVTVAKPANAVRETAMVPGQVFPLMIEPADVGLNLIDWVAANRADLERKLLVHGGIIFRGFGLKTPQDFEAFAEAVQPGLYGQYGDLPKKEGGKNTYRSTPYPEQKMILFHNEGAHQDRWPRKQLFFCELPSPIGGTTPVVDCRMMYQRLPDALRQRLEEKGLLYVRTFTDKLDVSWQHFFKTESRAEVEYRCQVAGIQWRWLDNDELQIRTRCPAVIEHPITGQKSFFNQVQLHHVYCLDADVREDLLALYGLQRMPRHVYYGDGSPIEDADMALIGELYEACAVRFDWQIGDVVLVDNMLTAHARDPFQGPRKIVVAMGDMMERADLEAFTLNRTGVQA
nr:non-ribosomal peptide synthetase [Azomonas agilis]